MKQFVYAKRIEKYRIEYFHIRVDHISVYHSINNQTEVQLTNGSWYIIDMPVMQFERKYEVK